VSREDSHIYPVAQKHTPLESTYLSDTESQAETGRAGCALCRSKSTAREAAPEDFPSAERESHLETNGDHRAANQCAAEGGRQWSAGGRYAGNAAGQGDASTAMLRWSRTGSPLCCSWRPDFHLLLLIYWDTHLGDGMLSLWQALDLQWRQAPTDRKTECVLRLSGLEPSAKPIWDPTEVVIGLIARITGKTSMPELEEWDKRLQFFRYLAQSALCSPWI
jgi:hypothetical protein